MKETRTCQSCYHHSPFLYCHKRNTRMSGHLVIPVVLTLIIHSSKSLAQISEPHVCGNVASRPKTRASASYAKAQENPKTVCSTLHVVPPTVSVLVNKPTGQSSPK